MFDAITRSRCWDATEICVSFAHVIDVESDGAELEQRLSSLQAQIDGLRQAATDDVRPLEQRLSTLTEYSASILKRWEATADRHARAVSELEAHLRELGDVGTHLQQDASQRLRDLERIVEQEWTALRHIHEAPVRQLVEQAANLTEVCIATANSAQHGFDRAEARLATLEADFHRTTSELTRDVQALLAEVRQLSATGPRQLAGDSPAWPLEGVTRLHHQLRESAGGPLALPQPAAVALPAPPALIERGSIEVDQAGPQPKRDLAGTRSFSRAVVAAILAVVIVVAAGYAWSLQRDVRAAAERVEQSQLESRRAAELAGREAAERQEAAARQLPPRAIWLPERRPSVTCSPRRISFATCWSVKGRRRLHRARCS